MQFFQQMYFRFQVPFFYLSFRFDIESNSLDTVTDRNRHNRLDGSVPTCLVK